MQWRSIQLICTQLSLIAENYTTVQCTYTGY